MNTQKTSIFNVTLSFYASQQRIDREICFYTLAAVVDDDGCVKFKLLSHNFVKKFFPLLSHFFFIHKYKG